MWWATDVSIAFERVEEGFETALRDYNKKQVMLNLEACNVKCDVAARWGFFYWRLLNSV